MVLKGVESVVCLQEPGREVSKARALFPLPKRPDAPVEWQ